jgi:hypothetical protein
MSAGGAAVTQDYRTNDLTDDVSFEDLVKELDAILDAWFLEDVSPALEDARAAREALEKEKAAA